MSKLCSLGIFLSVIIAQCTAAQSDIVYKVTYSSTIPNLSIRALVAVNDSIAWFAANRGVWGYTENGGKSWHIDSIKVDNVYPQFRSIAVLNESTVLLLSVASPAYLFKTTNKGKTWKLVYKKTGKDIFFDSMIFTDVDDGFALGDPVDSCFQLIRTYDGGDTWQPLPCTAIPKALPGEGCFAASNTCLCSRKNNVWFVTGGLHTRVFHSNYMGNRFEVYSAPLPQGEQMTGIYSVDFANELTGVIAGGNYNKLDTSITSLAITYNGGRTWKPVKTAKPLFGSCARFITSDEFYVTGSGGTFSYNIQTGKSSEVNDSNGASLVYYTLAYSRSGNTMWMAGANGKIALVTLGSHSKGVLKNLSNFFLK